MKKKINEDIFRKAFSRKRNPDGDAVWIISEKSVDNLQKRIEEERFHYREEMDRLICFYDLEIEFLKSLPSEKIKRLFYSLLCFEKLHWHESGWIRFEIDELAELGGLKTLKCEDFADLVSFGLKMRVTGSKNAVSTYYSIGWTIEKQTEKDRKKKAVDVLGTECAEKFWEVMNID